MKATGLLVRAAALALESIRDPQQLELALRRAAAGRIGDGTVADHLAGARHHESWLRRFATPPPELVFRAVEKLPRKPLFSLLGGRADDSLYDRWELIERVEDARGEFVVFLDAGMKLLPHALWLLAREADGADILQLDAETQLRPELDPELLLECSSASRGVAIRTRLLREAGGSGRLESLLRCLTPAARVRRIPHVGLRFTSADEAASDELEVVARHTGLRVDAGPRPGLRRVRWQLPSALPRVSVIVPTRDQPELLRRCIEGLQRTDYAPLELIFVDNGTRDPSALSLLRQLAEQERARILRDDSPFNYSALNNLGARAATGDFLCLLNNDVEPLDTGWLKELVAQALRPGVGAVGARLLYPDRTVQHAGLVVGMFGSAGHLMRGAREEDPGPNGEALASRRVSAVTGACLIVRRDQFLEQGGLDPGLAVAFNDVDLCLRLRSAGLHVLYAAHAELLHHESKSRGYDDSIATRRRLLREAALLQRRFRTDRFEDPAFSPNFSLRSETPALAWPPRVPRPWDVSP
jgi:GT2 family glycosyltransferase